MSAQKDEPFERDRILAKAVARWDNEGGAGEGGSLQPRSGASLPDALPLTSAEIAHLQVRVIALENLVKVLLVDAPTHQVELMRNVAAFISPRPGCTQHPLTIHATTCMINLIESAGHLRELPPSGFKLEDLSP